VPIFAVDYRKPPAFPYPAAVDDVLAVYKSLRGGGCAEKVFLGGDSAGGNLALVASKRLAASDTPPPEGVVLLCPWADPSDTQSESFDKYYNVDWINQYQLEAMAKLYASGMDLSDVRISPALAYNWRDWRPPVLLDYGGSEVFRSQIERLLSSMTMDGVSVDAHRAEGMVHCYPILDFIPGADPAPAKRYVDRVVGFLQR